MNRKILLLSVILVTIVTLNIAIVNASQGLLEDAQREFLVGNIKEAQNKLDAYLKNNSGDPRGYYLKFQIYKSQDEFEKARKSIEKALQLDPHNIEFLMAISKLYMDAGQNEKALQWYKKLLKLDEKLPKVYENMAHIYMRQGEYEEARKYMKMGVEKDPGYAQGYVLLGEINTELYNTEEAVKNYETALEKGEKDKKVLYALAAQYEENNENERAIETYKRIAEENPGEAEPYRELARLYRLKGDHVESVKAWLSYVFDGLPPEEIVNFLAGMTIAFLIMVYPPVANLVITILLIPFVYLAGVTGNLPGLERLSNIAALFSLDYLIYITNKEIVKLDEKNAVAWSNIGKYYEHRKKFQKAENCYLKALQSDPDMVETVFSLGKVYMVQEKFEQAKLSFKKALTLDSENGTYWYNLGAALYEEGFYSDAANAAKNSLEKSPESISAFSLYIDASEFAGETLECREYLEKVVNKISDDLPALMKMGRFLVEIGQANDALHYFQEAIVLEPDSYEVWYEYGIAQRELGMLEKAANSLDRAADLSQGLPWVLISTGLIRFIKNDLKQSEELLRQALDIDPFSAYGHFLLGRILRKNNSNQATNYLKKSIDFLKNDLEETKKPWEKASNYERMAIAHELTGDKKLARESLDLAVNFAGKTPETLRIFCEERMKLCSPEEFIMECNQKLQMLESEGHVGLEIKKEPS